MERITKEVNQVCVHNQNGVCMIDPAAGCNPSTCPFADAEDRELAERLKRDLENENGKGGE